MIQNSPADAHGHRPSAGIFRAFLKLGLSSFGGPIAHLGYFHSEFVVRRKWLDEAAFADLVALCQFLPGPASSQVGFSIGLATGGYRGALAAWLGFTLPSAVLMVLFAYGAGAAAGPYAQALLHGLKLVAVVVVAQAVWGMARTLSRGWTRAAISLASVLIALLIHSTWAQVTAIACGAVAGWLLSNPTAAPDSLASLRVDVSRQVAAGALAAFLALLVLPELPGHFASAPEMAFSMPSTAPGRWSLAAVTLSSRCCSKRSSPPAGSPRTPSFPVTGLPRHFRAPCSRSPRTWARLLTPRPAALRGQRLDW